MAAQPNYVVLYIISIIFCFICLIQFSLIFICPTFEFLKLELFEKNGVPIQKPIEYTYLVLTFLHIGLHLLLILCCCFFGKKHFHLEFSVATILWLVIPLIYTHYTIHELGDVPLSCPPDYPYENTKLFQLCHIRTANLFCMWLMFVITLISTLIMCISEETYASWVGVDDDDAMMGI
ncbi:hypothetical protein C1645_769914, partial [Glomus cerebriforme]